MDSYEYYLLYHQDRSKFMGLLSHENQEILIAVLHLLKNEKFEENDREVLTRQMVNMISNDGTSNFILDEILEKSMTVQYILTSKDLFEDNEFTVQHLRIVNKVVDLALLHSIEDLLHEICTKLVEMIFKESSLHSYIIAILKRVIFKNEKHAKEIMDMIMTKSLERNDQLALQNLCYFFDKMCRSKIMKSERVSILIKYFESDLPFARKQGIFLIKSMIDNKTLSAASEWKRFTIIMDALEENQSHLILPTLELLREIKLTDEFEIFWFILCKSILTHENNLVSSWGLKYIVSLENRDFSKEQIVIIMNCLNSTTLFDTQTNNFISNLNSFIEKNFENIFETLVDVNWSSAPFYFVLNHVKDHVKKQNFNKKFLNILQKQTDVLPLRIKNLTIRCSVQKLYAEILSHIMDSVELQQVLMNIMINIFQINNKNYECLDKCLSKIHRENYDMIFTDSYPYEFLKYALFKLHIEENISEIKLASRKIKSHKKLIMETICHLNEFVRDGYEEYPDELVHETIEDMWTHITENQFEALIESIDTLEIGLIASNNDIEADTRNHLFQIWRKIELQRHTCTDFEYAYWKILKIILKFDLKFDVRFVEAECYETSSESLKFLNVECQVALIRNKFVNQKTCTLDEKKIIIGNLDNLLDNIVKESEFLIVYENIENLLQIIAHDLIQHNELRNSLIFFLKHFIYTFNVNESITIEFWMR